MSKTTNAPPAEQLTEWSDERLVKECLKGNQDAWTAIVDRYRKLIYSVPIKYGLSPDDAGDIFQQVCLQLLEALPNLREPKSLPAWLIKVTAHGCFQLAGRIRRLQPFDFETQLDGGPITSEKPDELIHEFERSRILHEVLSDVPPRCRELIRMLFFETPAVSYEEAAKRLGLATGSIGFIRMRCLNRVRKQLEERGFS
jgi:RNA polymerase sigma factor (sigma-70 family)